MNGRAVLSPRLPLVGGETGGRIQPRGIFLVLRITLWEAEKIQLDGEAEGVWEKIFWSFLASP